MCYVKETQQNSKQTDFTLDKINFSEILILFRHLEKSFNKTIISS